MKSCRHVGLFVYSMFYDSVYQDRLLACCGAGTWFYGLRPCIIRSSTAVAMVVEVFLVRER